MNDEIDVMASNNDKTMIAPPQNADATMLGMSVKCAVCGTENAPGEKYCGDCGFLLASSPGESIGESQISARTVLTDIATKQDYYLHPGENTIGREMADVMLNDPTVSWRHARIVLEDGRCLVEDLGSTNGTMVRGEKVTALTEIVDGDEIRVGSVALTVSMPLSVDAQASQTAPEVTPSPDALENAEADDGYISDEPAVKPLARLISAREPAIEFEILPGVNTIGRRGDNDIRIVDDPYVSGGHAEITANEGWFEIVDMGSTNGTIVNGVKLDPDEPMQLSDGAQITFGRTQVRFEVLAADDYGSAEQDEQA